MSTGPPNHVVEMIDAVAIIPMDHLIDEIGRDRFYEAPIKEMTVDGSCYAIPIYSHAKNSKHPEICEAFIKFLYQPEYYVPFLQSVPLGMLPALKYCIK